MGVFVRLADLLLTNDLDTALRLLDRQATSGGGGRGFGGLGVWRYQTATTSNPPAGELQFDNLDIDSATNLYINEINDAGTDMSEFLSLVTIGDLIYIQAQDSGTQFVTVQVGTPSFSGGVYTFPLTASEAQGAQLTQNQEVSVVITKGSVGIGITVEDEGTPLTTAATSLDFVGTGVDASGLGATKTITIPGGGVTDHGALTGLADDDHTQYLHKDITRNVTVGYTTDIEADTFTHPFTPVMTLEHFKTVVVTSNFTLEVPTTGSAVTGGHCEYYVSATGTGPYTITKGNGLEFIDGNVTITVGRNYILNIHRFSSTNAVAQLQQVPETSFHSITTTTGSLSLSPVDATIT